MPNLNRRILLLFIALIITISVNKKVGAENTLFDVYDLNVEGQQVGYLVEDLNGDGINDILFFHSRKKGKDICRHFSIFYHTANGFNNTADQSLQIDGHEKRIPVSDDDLPKIHPLLF